MKFLILITLIYQVFSAAKYTDANTVSNYQDVQLESYHLDWKIDFNTQEIDAKVHLSFKTLKRTSVVVLDSWSLQYPGTPNQCQYQGSLLKNVNLTCILKNISETQGDQLTVDVFSVKHQSIEANKKFNLTIQYGIFSNFNNFEKALSFLTAEQTATKLQPYLFTQNEPIYARSLVPIQDTPSVKAKYTASVTTTKNINNVYMSARSTGKTSSGDFVTYSFEQRNNIPSYLLAIVAGNIERKEVGQRTGVISEIGPGLDLAAKELSDLEEYVETIENYLGVPYDWDIYNVVVMPPSFPYGGMENPLLTFASPSIIDPTGSKTGVSVAIHEIAHSWTGNTVTCGNWSNMWLNEVFLERQAGRELFGEEFYKIEAINGNQSINDYFASSVQRPSYYTLNPDTKNTDPDDSFSEVPYEKGFQFLTYISTVINSTNMQELLHSWVNDNAYESRIWLDFQDHFTRYCTKKYQDPKPILQLVDFNLWEYQSKVGPKQDILNKVFSTPLVQQASDLADQFIALQGSAKPNDTTFNFTAQGNKEISWRWYKAAIYSKYQPTLSQQISDFMGSIGRMKLILPLYSAYMDTNQQEVAKQIFGQYQSFYHPVAREFIRSIIYPSKMIKIQN